jgi:hypothetical protein
MNRHHWTIAALALVGAMGASVSAGAVERVSRSAGDVKMASSDVARQPEIIAPVAASPAVAAPCARKVKMVYAGYGEADRASCAEGSNGVVR